MIISAKTCTTCQKEKPLKDFYNQNDRKSGKASVCKSCFNSYCVERWIRRKIEAITAYGGKCKRCNLTLEESHYSVFEFHHRNPKEKDYNWTKIRLMSKSKQKAELDKCDLLCANCHRIIHAKINEGFPEQ